MHICIPKGGAVDGTDVSVPHGGVPQKKIVIPSGCGGSKKAPYGGCAAFGTQNSAFFRRLDLTSIMKSVGHGRPEQEKRGAGGRKTGMRKLRKSGGTYVPTGASHRVVPEACDGFSARPPAFLPWVLLLRRTGALEETGWTMQHWIDF